MMQTRMENMRGSVYRKSGAGSHLTECNRTVDWEEYKDYTIKHFFDSKEKNGVFMPTLGRINLSKSLHPLKGFDKILSWIM